MISIATITIKTTKPRAVAAFWRDLPGYEAPGAIHLDLRPDDQGEAVAAALALGASHADIGQTGPGVDRGRVE